MGPPAQKPKNRRLVPRYLGQLCWRPIFSCTFAWPCGKGQGHSGVEMSRDCYVVEMTKYHCWLSKSSVLMLGHSLHSTQAHETTEIHSLAWIRCLGGSQQSPMHHQRTNLKLKRSPSPRLWCRFFLRFFVFQREFPTNLLGSKKIKTWFIF